ncbi:MAG: hypothetical protein RLZZ490_851 [Cyanobacteriota bacterium]
MAIALARSDGIAYKQPLTNTRHRYGIKNVRTEKLNTVGA